MAVLGPLACFDPAACLEDCCARGAALPFAACFACADFVLAADLAFPSPPGPLPGAADFVLAADLAFGPPSGLATGALARSRRPASALPRYASRAAVRFRIAEVLGNVGVAIGNVASMPRIVTPCRIGDAGAIELIVAIDIDVDAAAPPVEAAPNRRTDGRPRRKGQDTPAGEAGGGPVEGFIAWMGPVPVNNPGVVDRDVHVFGACRLYGDDRRRAAFRRRYHAHLLLVGGLEMARGLGALPQALDCRQELFLLGQNCIAQLLRPVELVAHHLQCLGYRGEGPDARFPWLLLHGILQWLAGETRVFTQPACRWTTSVG